MDKKKNLKICGLCNNQIADNDNYVRITDYFAGKFHSEGFYHTNCYIKRISGGERNNKMMQMAAGLLGRAKKMMDNAEGGQVIEV